MSKPHQFNIDKAGWRVAEWSENVGIGRAYTYELIRDGKIESVKLSGARIITTSPRDYIKMLLREQRPEL